MTRDNIPARVSSLETSVEGLHTELGDVKRAMTAGFRDIQASLSANNRTNWPLIISAIMLVMAVYAAAIRPVQSDVERIERNALTQATAVLEQNRVLNETRVDASLNAAHIADVSKDVEELQTQGSRTMDKRLAVIEYKLGISK